MNASQHHSPLPSIYADDEEIKRYAGLLESLGVGLMVFSPDASPCFQNGHASNLLGNSQPKWLDVYGHPIAVEDQPLNQVLRTSQAVLGNIMVLASDKAHNIWLIANAIPVLSEKGDLRRILLTLTDISERQILKNEIEKLSIRDPLTGVFTEQHVMQRLENEIHRARRYGTPFTLAQLDIDNFHPLCAEHGQQFGDIILTVIGELLNKCMREIDIAGRVGDNEFLLILPNVSLKDSMIGLERLRVLIETQAFTKAELQVTISGGITEYTGESSETLVERSRSLMINAREAGCNRFCLDLDII